MGAARSVYLFAYNASLSVGWACILSQLVLGVRDHKTRPEIYQDIKPLLLVAQTAAVIEVIHSAVGLVRAPFFTTFIQVLSRIWAVWGIIMQAETATSKGSIDLLKISDYKLSLDMRTLLFAWSVTEVLRYGFFAIKEVASPPYFLLWLRYSAFIPLYPLGVASEMTMAYLAFPTIKKDRPLSIRLPNKLNWGFDYYIFCWVAVACYLPGLPILYLHMLKQRSKLLRGGSAGKIKVR